MEHKVITKIARKLNYYLHDSILVAKEEDVDKAIAIVDLGNGYEVRADVTSYSSEVTFFKDGRIKDQYLLSEALENKMLSFEDVETDAEMQQRMIDEFYEDKQERSRI